MEIFRFQLDKHVAENTREQMEIVADPLKIEDGLIINPWAGKDISAFLKYCCPECQFNNLDLQLFTNHALENHTNATALFADEIGNELGIDIKIEELEDNYFFETSNVDENKDLDCVKKPNKNSSIKQKQESIIQEQTLCEICPILDLTTSSLELKSHRNKNHKNGQQFFCPHCDKKDNTWSKILKHISSNHKEHYKKKFFCDICDESFIFSNICTNHKKCAHMGKEARHTCDICGNHYAGLYGLNQHILLKHNSEGATKFFCEKCGYSTVSKVMLGKHMYRKHNTEKHKMCQYCDFTSPLKTKLHVHIDVNHPEKEEINFLCDKCNRSFIYKASFDYHSKYKCKYSDYAEKEKRKRKGMHPNTSAKKYKLFQCDYCDEAIKTTTSNKIKQHYDMHHCGRPIIKENHEKFKCLNCNDVFLFEDELNRHRNLEHGIKTNKNYCPQCKMSYVEIHKCQKAKDGFPCEHCNKTYSSRQHLIGHIKTEHEKQLDFECSTCGKKVGTKSKLQNHVYRCHSQVTCEICNKEIANPTDLKRHKFAAHKDTTGVWLCESCPKSVFFTKSRFDQHVKEKH
jgi:hypothetical protein